MDPRDAMPMHIVLHTEVDVLCGKLTDGRRKYCQLSSTDDGLVITLSQGSTFGQLN